MIQDRPLIESNINVVGDLCVDNLMYWVSIQEPAVKMAFLNGTRQITLRKESEADYTGITLYNKCLYISDSSRRSVFYIGSPTLIITRTRRSHRVKARNLAISNRSRVSSAHTVTTVNFQTCGSFSRGRKHMRHRDGSRCRKHTFQCGIVFIIIFIHQ